MPNATPKDNISLPVLKAWARIFELLECIYDHPYDREGFQEAVVNLYGGDKSSKSVFRGMAVPTLRNLGLIVGYGDDIRASANGSLLHIAKKEKESEGLRVLRAILVEIDENIGVLPYLAEKPTVSANDFLQDWLNRVTTSKIRKSTGPKAQERASRERLLDWINFLAFSEMLYKNHDQIRIDNMNLERTNGDLDITAHDKSRNFQSLLFASYRKIVFEQKGIGTVELDNLRQETSVQLYKKYKVVLTERQFNKLLSELPKASDKYVIALGRSMGADEKLYFYQGKYYQTLFIRFLTPEEVTHG
ncbi:MAG: hypothetical protein Q8L41_02605 [Anaerolineales bacterium]|nr:hypothetical protein [Anaerolineales bacterium]